MPGCTRESGWRKPERVDMSTRASRASAFCIARDESAFLSHLTKKIPKPFFGLGILSSKNSQAFV